TRIRRKGLAGDRRRGRNQRQSQLLGRRKLKRTISRGRDSKRRGRRRQGRKRRGRSPGRRGQGRKKQGLSRGSGRKRDQLRRVIPVVVAAVAAVTARPAGWGSD